LTYWFVPLKLAALLLMLSGKAPAWARVTPLVYAPVLVPWLSAALVPEISSNRQ